MGRISAERGGLHILVVQLFNGVVDDVTGSRDIPEIDMAAAQPGSNTISAHRTARNKIPTLTSIFSMSRFNGVVDNATGSRIIREIVYCSNISTSGL